MTLEDRDEIDDNEDKRTDNNECTSQCGDNFNTLEAEASAFVIIFAVLSRWVVEKLRLQCVEVVVSKNPTKTKHLEQPNKCLKKSRRCHKSNLKYNTDVAQQTPVEVVTNNATVDSDWGIEDYSEITVENEDASLSLGVLQRTLFVDRLISRKSPYVVLIHHSAYFAMSGDDAAASDGVDGSQHGDNQQQQQQQQDASSSAASETHYDNAARKEANCSEGALASDVWPIMNVVSLDAGEDYLSDWLPDFEPQQTDRAQNEASNNVEQVSFSVCENYDIQSPTNEDTQSSSIAVDIQSPSIEVDSQSPTNEVDIQSPSNEVDIQSPRNTVDIQSPSNKMDIQSPSNEGNIESPSNEGYVKLPCNEADIRSPGNDDWVASNDPLVIPTNISLSAAETFDFSLMPCFDASGDNAEVIDSVENIGSPVNTDEISLSLVAQNIPTDIVAVVAAEETFSLLSEVADIESQDIGSPDASNLPSAFDEMLSIPTNFIGDAGAAGAVSSNINLSLTSGLMDDVSFSDSFADIVQDIPTDISIADTTAFNASIFDITRPSSENATFDLSSIPLTELPRQGGIEATKYIAEVELIAVERKLAENDAVLSPAPLVCDDSSSKRFVNISTQNIPDAEACDGNLIDDGFGLADSSEGVSIIIMSNIPTDLTDTSATTDLNISSDSLSAVATVNEDASESVLMSPVAMVGYADNSTALVDDDDATAPVSFNIGSPDPKVDAAEEKLNSGSTLEGNNVFPECIIGSPGPSDACDTIAQCCLIPVVIGEIITSTVDVSGVDIQSAEAVVACASKPHGDVTKDVQIENSSSSSISVNKLHVDAACDSNLSTDITSPDDSDRASVSVAAESVGASLSGSQTTALFEDDLQRIATEEADLVYADVFDDIIRSLDCFGSDVTDAMAKPPETVTVDKMLLNTELDRKNEARADVEDSVGKPTASDAVDVTPVPILNADSVETSEQLMPIKPELDVETNVNKTSDVGAENAFVSDNNVISDATALDDIQSPTEDVSSDYFNIAFSKAAMRSIPTATTTDASKDGGENKPTNKSSRKSAETVLEGDTMLKTPKNARVKQRDNRKKRSRSGSHERSSKRHHHSRDRSHSNSKSRHSSRDRSHSNSRSRHRSRDRSRSNSRSRQSRNRSHSSRRRRHSKDRSRSISRSRHSRVRSHSNSRSRSRSQERRHRKNKRNRSRSLSKEKTPTRQHDIIHSSTSKQRRGQSSVQCLSCDRDEFASFWLHVDQAGSRDYEGLSRLNEERHQFTVHSTPFAKENLGRDGSGDASSTVNSWKQRNKWKAAERKVGADYEEYNDDWRIDAEQNNKHATEGKVSKHYNAEANIFSTDPQQKDLHVVKNTMGGSNENAENFSFDWNADAETSDRYLPEQNNQQVSDKQTLAQPSDYDPFCPTDEVSPTVPPLPPFASLSYPNSPLLALSRSRQTSPEPARILAAMSTTNVMSPLAAGRKSTVGDGNSSNKADSDPSMVLLPPPLPPPGFGIGPVTLTYPRPVPPPPSGVAPPVVGVALPVAGVAPPVAGVVPPVAGVALSSSVRPLFPAVMPPQPFTATPHNLSSAAVDVYSPFGDDMDDEDRLAWEEERAVEIMVCQRRDVAPIAPQMPTTTGPLSIGSPSPVPFMDVGISPSYDDSDDNQRQPIPQWLAGDRDAYASAFATAAAITGKRNDRSITNELMEVVDMDVESPDSVSPIASPVVEKSFSQTSAKLPPDVTRHQQQAARSLDVASPSAVDIASPTEESGDIASPITDDILSPPCSPMGNFLELDLVPKIIPTFAVLPAKKVKPTPPQPSGKSVPANQNAAKMKLTNRTRDSYEVTEKVPNKRESLNSRALSTSLTPPALPKSTPDTRTSSSVSATPLFSTQSLASELLKTAQSANKKHQQAVVETRKVALATEAAKSADTEAAAKIRSIPVAEPKKVVRSRFDDNNIDILSSQSHAKPSADTLKYVPETEIPAKTASGKQSPIYAPRSVAKLDSMKKSETLSPTKQQQQPVASKKVSPIYETSLLSSVQSTSAAFKLAQQTTKQPEIFRSSQPTVAEVNRMSESVQPKQHQPVYETIRAVDSDRMYNLPHVSSVAETSTTQGPGLFERLKAVGLVAPPPVAMETEKPLLMSEKATTLEPAYGNSSDEVPSGSAWLPTQVIKKPTTVQSLLEAFRLPTHPPNQTQGTVGASTSVAAATAALPEVSALNILEALKLTSLLTAQKFPTSSDFVVSSSSKTKTRKPPLPLPDLSGVVSPSPDDADSFTPDAGTSKDDEYIMKLSRRERVIEEVKKALRPFYSRRQITKDDYKDVLRKAVPKICNSKSGEINPAKIKDYVDRYVLKEMQLKKYLAKKYASGKMTDSEGMATKSSDSHDYRKHHATSKKHKDKRSRSSDKDKSSSKKHSILTLPLPKSKN